MGRKEPNQELRLMQKQMKAANKNRRNTNNELKTGWMQKKEEKQSIGRIIMISAI